jgi:hypothetical protein
MTEEEAKKKWCPMFHKRINVFINKEEVDAIEERMLNHKKQGNCIASDCMMWKWINNHKDGYNHVGKPALGYCGLGGKE